MRDAFVLLVVGAAMSGFAADKANPGLHAPDIVPIVEQPAPSDRPVTLVKDGKLRFAIVADLAAERKLVTARRRPSVKPAVELLVRQFERATGEKPSVFSSDDTESYQSFPALIVVGDTPLTRAAGVHWEKLPKQGFVVTTFAKGVIICGHDTIRVPGYNEKPMDRNGDGFGTLFGAYDFCERFLGSRWYFPGPLGTLQPALTDLTLAPVRYEDSPWFDTRGNAYGCYLSANTPEKLERVRRLLGADLDFKTDIQGYYKHGRIGRTLPYRGEHAPNPFHLYKAFPDLRETIFFRELSGKLWASETNCYACYFNVFDLKFADFLVEIWKRAFESEGKDDPAKLGPYIGTGYCDFGVCDTCLAPRDYMPLDVVRAEHLVTDEDVKRGTDTGDERAVSANIYGRFYKYLCERMQEELPGCKLNIIAYYNSKFAPTRYKLPDNFEVSLCDGKLLTWIRDPEQQEASRKLFGEWREACNGRGVDQAYIYSSDDPLACAVTPQFIGDIPKVLGDRISRGGIFFDHGCDWRHFYAYYIGLRAQWNPAFDRTACRGEMCRRLFGEDGGKAVAKFLTGVERVALKYPMRLKREPCPPKAIDSLEKLFRLAERAVPKGGDEEKRFRLLADYWPGAFKKLRETYRKAGAGAYVDAVFVKGRPDATQWSQMRSNAFLPYVFAWNAEGIWVKKGEKKGGGGGRWGEVAFLPDPKREIEYRFKFAADGTWTSEKQRIRPVPQPADTSWRPAGVTCERGVLFIPMKAFETAAPKVYEWWEVSGTHVRFAGRGDEVRAAEEDDVQVPDGFGLRAKSSKEGLSLVLSNSLISYAPSFLRIPKSGNTPWRTRASLEGGKDSKSGFGCWSDFFELTVNGIESGRLMLGTARRWTDGESAGWDIPLNFDGTRVTLRLYLKIDSDLLFGEIRFDPASSVKPRAVSLVVEAIPSWQETSPKPRYDGYARKVLELKNGGLLLTDEDYDGSSEEKGVGPCYFRLDPAAVIERQVSAGEKSKVTIRYMLKPEMPIVRFALWDDRDRRKSVEDFRATHKE